MSIVASPDGENAAFLRANQARAAAEDKVAPILEKAYIPVWIIDTA